MPETCCFPYCDTPPTRRDDGTWACPVHAHVHVSSSGSWLESEAS